MAFWAAASRGEASQVWPPASTVFEKELSHVEVFKAQRIFNAFCNKDAIITREKFGEFLDAASLSGRCDHLHEKFCRLAGLLVACQRWFPLDQVWKRLQGRVGSDCLHIDWINNEMQRSDASVRAMSKDQLLAELDKTSDLAMVCLIKIRLASLLLGEKLNITARVATPAGDLEEAKHYLKHALAMNPAWWEAHAWMAVAQWRSGKAEHQEAIISARRSVMLNRKDGRMWDNLGRMAYETGDPIYASLAWLNGAAAGNYAAALRYGMTSSMDEMAAAAAFQLGIRLAITPESKAQAEKLLQDVVAKNPRCAEVEPLKPALSMVATDDTNVRVGDRLLF